MQDYDSRNGGEAKGVRIYLDYKGYNWEVCQV